MYVYKVIFLFVYFLFGNAFAQNIIESDPSSDKIEFTSDKFEVDENNNITIASGNVIIKSDERKITADKIKYFKNLDKAIASGNVVLIEKDGTRYESQIVELTDNFKSIMATPLYAELPDKSFINAEKFKKKQLGESFFSRGLYSACECNFKDGEKPVWSISAKKITHNPTTKTIYLDHPIMRIASIPVYYLPHLSFPDWTVRRRSGFLTPTFGYSKRDRFNVKIPYYYAPENDETWDMTFTSHQNAKTGHAEQLNVRKKYESTSLKTNIFSGNLDTEKSDGDDVFGFNFSISSKIQNKWKMNLQAKYADQDTFMRRYDFDEDNIYKSFINLEKTNENSFSNIEIYNVRNLDKNSGDNEPTMAPSITHHIFNQNNKYDYDIKFSAHSIYNDERYDIKRWSGNGEIYKKINYNGLLIQGDANLGLDLYSIQGRPFTDKNDNKYIDRFSTGFSLAASHQSSIISEKTSILFEPKIQLSSIFSPDRSDEVPNRDSSEFRLDEANLFMTNQYQGRDNIQRIDRLNLGITSLLLTNNLGDINFFLGQSQKLSGTQKNIVTSNENRQSHLINSIDWNPNKMLNLSWFSLYNHHNLKSDLSDLNINGSVDQTSYSINRRSINKDFISNNTNRDELKVSLSHKISNLKASYSTTYNLKNNNEQKISETLGLSYSGEGYTFGNCLTILLEYKSTGGVNDRDLLSEDSINLSLSFKNLSELKF